MTRVHGYDLALNHGAVIELEDGELSAYWFWTTLAGVAKKKHGARLNVPKHFDRQGKSVFRLDFVETFLATIMDARKPDFVGIEDYALQADQGAHYMGEVGGIARLMCWKRGFKLRLHDPGSMKMFATLNGNCPKANVEGIVKKRWGTDFGHVNQPAKPGKKQNRDSSGDLTDAMIAARLVWTEVQLRAGTMALSDLKEEKERRVFLRVTKPFPLNILAREWICPV